jgi:hypothetical protein
MQARGHDQGFMTVAEPRRRSKEMMMLLSQCLAILLLLSGPTAAEDADAVAALTQDLRARAPSQWEIRVRWQDGQLLASVTPLPYQAAFDLWYDAPRLLKTLQDLCPSEGEPVWSLLRPDQDVVIEPTVGGKSGVEARVSCRKVRLNHF